MAVKVISYDLNAPGQDYEPLYKEIRSFPGYCLAMDSVWLVSTEKSCQGVFDKLKQHIDDDDFLLVNVLSGYRQGWLKKSVWEWIKKHE